MGPVKNPDTYEVALKRVVLAYPNAEEMALIAMDALVNFAPDRRDFHPDPRHLPNNPKD